MAIVTPRLAFVVLIGLASITAARGQASIGDCEKIQAADAYNQCLAKFGPTSKVKSLEPERPGDMKGSSEEAAAGAGRPMLAFGAGKATRGGHRGRGGRAVRRGGGGRKRMVISVGRRHR